MQYIDCYINPITRLVTYPASTTIVQKDTNVEVLRFHFSLEAEHDLEDDSIRVMVLKGGETRGFNAENVRIETNDGGDEELVFEHTITTYETAEPGQIAVSICGNQVSGNVISEAWHTLNMTFQVSGAAHTDSDEGEDTPETAASNAEKIAALQTLVGAVTSGRPIPVDLKSKMVDTDAIYLYTGNETGEQTNYWYYHNGTSWVPGTEYGSMTVDDTLSVTGAAADAKATGDAVANLNGRLDQLDGGLTADVKAALLACFAHVAWDSDDPTGQSYISALQTALYPPANLSSISAVYTQSGTVWTTDTLDSLKTNLVVTAHYSDSTSEVLASSAYTLSGTLTEGTRTITVGYGGKTATFNVIVTRYDSSVYSWDFTSGITDSKQNVQATLGSGVTQNSSGLTFDGTTNGYVYLANLSAYATSAFTIEIDVTTIPETAYAFLVNLNQQADLGANATGLCFDGTKWWFKTSANANVSIASDTLTDETIFNGKTLKVQIDYANSTMSLYNDGTLLGTATIYNKSNGRDYLGIGSSKSTQLTVAAGTVITAVRVYEGVV